MRQFRMPALDGHRVWFLIAEELSEAAKSQDSGFVYIQSRMCKEQAACGKRKPTCLILGFSPAGSRRSLYTPFPQSLSQTDPEMP